MFLNEAFTELSITTFMMVIRVGFFKGLGQKTKDYMDPDPGFGLGDQRPFLSNRLHQSCAFSVWSPHWSGNFLSWPRYLL